MNGFEEFRETCPAIKHILLKDEVFESWKKIVLCNSENPEANAHHQSALLLAFKRGQIEKMVAPVFRYLLDNQGEIKKNVRKSYLNALTERWVVESSPAERHRKFRMFMGKLVELKVAEWLDDRGWKIEGLEAFQEGAPDIVVRDQDGHSGALEVKYIGQEDDDFQLLLDNLNGKVEAKSICPYKACNYALFRIYEAAYQLKNAQQPNRIVILVVDALAWGALETQLKGNWMEEWGYNLRWNESVKNDCKWMAFYLSQKQKPKYKDLDSEIPKVIKSLSQIHIMKIEGWELPPLITINFGNMKN